MKKLLSIVLALCFVLSMTGVALAEDVQTINVCIGSQPETLDPQLNSASDGSNYIKHLFEGLMKASSTALPTITRSATTAWSTPSTFATTRSGPTVRI